MLKNRKRLPDMGIGSDKVHMFETGCISSIRLSMLDTICEYYGCEPQYFIVRK